MIILPKRTLPTSSTPAVEDITTDPLHNTDTLIATEDALSKRDPLNISLLILTPDILRRMGQVKSKDVYEQNSTVFKKDGLFSTEIFGPVGSKERLKRFGYIDLGLEVFHPRIYKELSSLSTLYKGILEGTKYAKFDPKLKDFVETDRLEGSTGYNLFFKYYDQIDFKTTDSVQRLFKILFIKKHKLQDVKISKYIVIPAGLRDYLVTESGKVLENEINNLYRKLLTVANTANQFKHETRDIELINQIRVRLQKVIISIYDYIENMLDGKSKFIQGKWTKRAIFYGTRNVITGTPTVIKDAKELQDPNKELDIEATVGPLQFAKAILPKTLYLLRTKFLNDKFSVETSTANLINKKTLQREPAKITEKARSQWVTDEGLENMINKMIQSDLFMSPIIIDDKYYLMLVVDKGDTIYLINDIRQITNEEDKKYVRPLTYIELLYITLFQVADEHYAYLTRYPVTGYGSTVIVKPYLKATTKTRRVKLYLPNTTEPVSAPEYPVFKEDVTPFYSLTVPYIYLPGLGADFDGEMLVDTY